MTPMRFDGFTKILGAPTQWNEDKYGPCDGLPVACNDSLCVSVWKLTWGERFRILFGENIQLQVCSGQTQPPVALHVTNVRESAS